MKKHNFKTQAELFGHILEEYVEDEETCISEFCVKNKTQAYDNLKQERNYLAEEWNRLTEAREKQIRAEAIDEILKQIEQEEKECENVMCSPSFWSVKRIVRQMLKEQNDNRDNF